VKWNSKTLPIQHDIFLFHESDAFSLMGEKTLFHQNLSCLYLAYTVLVNVDIYMKFREAVDVLCSSLTHEDVAKALGVSVQTIRQARMKEDSKLFREPPKNWERALIRLAENRVLHYRRLIEKLRKSD